MLILSQDRKRLQYCNEIHVSGKRIYGSDIDLGKYDSSERAEAVFQNLLQQIKNAEKKHSIIELPRS